MERGCQERWECKCNWEYRERWRGVWQRAISRRCGQEEREAVGVRQVDPSSIGRRAVCKYRFWLKAVAVDVGLFNQILDVLKMAIENACASYTSLTAYSKRCILFSLGLLKETASGSETNRQSFDLKHVSSPSFTDCRRGEVVRHQPLSFLCR